MNHLFHYTTVIFNEIFSDSEFSAAQVEDEYLIASNAISKFPSTIVFEFILNATGSVKIGVDTTIYFSGSSSTKSTGRMSVNGIDRIPVPEVKDTEWAFA